MYVALHLANVDSSHVCSLCLSVCLSYDDSIADSPIPVKQDGTLHTVRIRRLSICIGRGFIVKIR